MAQKHISRTRVAAVIISCITLFVAATSVATAQNYAAPALIGQSENAGDALARHLRTLASNGRDFQALIGAGRAALALGDTQAAAGFFGRADEVWPTSPMPHIGMGAATVLEGEALPALAHFSRAERMGAKAVSMGADRGLAYDLLGRHADAQADYRAALAGTEADEARRRLALSLAITGDEDGALQTLNPLLARRDPGAFRSRALVLALTGDQNGARQVIDAMMPGSWVQMAPFIGRLGALNSAQKAAAVNLGIFPGAGASAPPAGTAVASAGGDRLADIEALLRPNAPPAASAQPPQQVASATATPNATRPQAVNPGTAATASRAVAAPARRRYWVQLASGADPAALPQQMRKIRSRSEDLLNGISGYVAEEPGRARLLVGPFRNASDAEVFAEELETLSVDAFRWISAEGQVVRKLTSE